MGDFSGRESRGVADSLTGRKIRRVDLDNFDTVMEQTAIRLEVELPRGEKVTAGFTKLEDFHPDRLWEGNEFFAPHREMRGELANPATFAAAMASLNTPSSAVEAPPEEDNGSLWSKLTGLPASTPAAAAPVSAADAIIRKAMAGHTVRGPDPRQGETLAAFDDALGGQMRALLHHPRFQALEAVWRGVDFLLRNLDTDDSLEVFLLDVSREELAADLRIENATPAVVDLLLDPPGGARPWTVLTGLYTFQPRSGDDMDLLARLAQVAAAGGLPFLGGAGPAFLEAARTGESEPFPEWQAVRSLPAARHAGLVTPRFLLRLPYGKKTDEIDHFAFEEVPAGNRGTLLWGNGALAAALVLATAWREEGWEFSPPANAGISGLPLFLVTEDGERKLTPCGEVLLTERLTENLLALGLMPLVTVRDRDIVRLYRFQSVAAPCSPLAGL